MHPARPQTALQAIACRRLLISGWPWRCAGYLLTTLPLALAALAGLTIPAVPWPVLAAGQAAGPGRRDRGPGLLGAVPMPRSGR